jgi:L-iditol 2-dehydrogenase
MFPPPAWNVDPNTVHYNLWKIIGAFNTTLRDLQRSVELLRRREFPLEHLIEARYKLNDIQAAFEKAAEKESYRVAVFIPD